MYLYFAQEDQQVAYNIPDGSVVLIFNPQESQLSQTCIREVQKRIPSDQRHSVQSIVEEIRGGMQIVADEDGTEKELKE